MAVPQTRSELLAAIEANYAKLTKDLAEVPTETAGAKTLAGHKQDTMMSVHDLVAYLIGWNELVLKWHERRAAGEVVSFPEAGFKWNQLGDLAQKFYADYADLSWPALLARFEAAKSRIIALVEGYDNDQLYGTPWYEKYTMGRMIQFNTSSPYANARARLRAWQKSL
ncbi:hypothetical protein VW29_08790 [Devosia limi DSM 17137]|uniref:ClbS/DfsB family four-helix bundle protein n=1 Tax=Devosia limi DSM 17137 TaxID=1121477 RepID=A0A0F5LRE4_9HYPH|nr:ClbS/DfsB family four-helix bundle protein [Devosia limi]KKB84913.1 hypothetical protein VW29_08790 [Devosia limi DSM 17137]SHF05938.1 hypothetical protein SAMN02745223_01706 [Devosia limi DSM 17137]